MTTSNETETVAHRGAPLGRSQSVPAPGQQITSRVHLHRIRLSAYGYDSAGAYWGLGEPLFHAFTECGTLDYHLRATSRGGAMSAVVREFGEVKFFR
jgi:hypothetical protein